MFKGPNQFYTSHVYSAVVNAGQHGIVDVLVIPFLVAGLKFHAFQYFSKGISKLPIHSISHVYFERTNLHQKSPNYT